MVSVVARTVVLVLLGGALASARAQDVALPDTPEVLNIAPAPTDRFPAKWYTERGDGTKVLPAPVLERPYTALTEDATVDQTPEGLVLRHHISGFVARDHLGRTYSEAETGGETIDGVLVKIRDAQVSDPVSHCKFRWLRPMTESPVPVDQRVAFVKCAPLTLRYKELHVFDLVLRNEKDGTTTHGDTVTTISHPGPLQVDGVQVDRLLVTNTTTHEAGHEKTTKTETWFSPYLDDVVRFPGDDGAYSGLMDIRLNEPDARLFYPPAGYRIDPDPVEQK